jgi:hypothetical protein
MIETYSTLGMWLKSLVERGSSAIETGETSGLLDAGRDPQSEVAHANALAAGASGVLFSIANANSQELSVADYEKFSRPFDKRFLEGISGARLNFMQSARRAGVFEPVPRLYGSGDQLLAACIRRPNHGGAAAVSHLGRGGRH